MIKLKDIFEAKLNGTASPLTEAADKALLSVFEKALDALVKKGKDFASVAMIKTAMDNINNKINQGTDVAELVKQHLEPANGKQGYYDLASYGLKEGKTETHAWAAAMSTIIKSVSPTLAKKLEGISGVEGEITTKATADKLVKAFKDAGYKPYEQIDDLWVIDAKGEDGVGVSVDYRKDMDYGSGKCLVVFFDDNQ